MLQHLQALVLKSSFCFVALASGCSGFVCNCGASPVYVQVADWSRPDGIILTMTCE